MQWPLRVALVGVLCLIPPGRARAAQPIPHRERRVLVLHSYHPTYEWTAQLGAGVVETLSGHVEDEKVFVDHLDLRRHPIEKLSPDLERLLRTKYGDFQPSVILTSDDLAFQFVREHRDALFPGVPVVFCGINDFHSEWLQTRPRWFTGIAEDNAIAENLALLGALHPHATRLIVISDPSPLGVAFSTETRELLKKRAPSAPPVEIWGDLDNEQMERRLIGLEASAAVFVAIRQRDGKGGYFSYSSDLPRITQQMAPPMYAQWGFTLGTGIVGGFVNDPKDHGARAAQMVLRILDGMAPEDIDIVPRAEYQPTFDHRALKRFGLAERDLPRDSRILFRPPSVFAQHPRLAYGVLVVLGVLVMGSGALIVNLALRKQAMVKLKESEIRYRQIFEGSLDAILVVDDATGQVVDVNGAAEPLFGAPRDQLRGLPLAALWPDYASRSAALSGSTESCATVSLGQQMLARARGAPFEGDISFGHYRLAEGLLNVISVHDLTERIQHEAKMRTMQKLEALGNLAGGMAHDFNNLLQPILGWTTLAQSIGDKEVQDTLEPAIAAAERAKALVAKVLSFARRSPGKLMPIDLSAAVRDTMELVHGSVPMTVQVELDLPQEPALVRADRTELIQVVMNLATNSCHAMKQNGGRLLIRVAKVPPTPGLADAEARGMRIRLEVSDTGTGIPKEIIGRLFEPLFTTKPEGEGTGFGLAIVHNVVSGAGGNISLESMEGKGTSFFVDLPAVVA